MGSPATYPQRQVSTRFLRVPEEDWSRVLVGEKTEFRTMPRESSRLLRCYVPTPVVAYATGGMRRHKLMVLLERRYEALIDVADDREALAREGFESYDLFRRYWRARQRQPYNPMQKVYVWRVRHFDDPTDIAACGTDLFKHLYGAFL